MQYNVLIPTYLLTSFLKGYVVIFDAMIKRLLTTCYKYLIFTSSFQQPSVLESTAIVHQHFFIGPKSFVPILQQYYISIFLEVNSDQIKFFICAGYTLEIHLYVHGYFAEMT